ncbi:MAG: hypothetical protein KDD37_09825 [Bdellovibrionales bacterium]|nr:hypothetical protein [Bdellovibrionales bacterium]
MTLEKLYELAKRVEKEGETSFLAFLDGFLQIKTSEPDIYQRFRGIVEELAADFSFEGFYPLLVFFENKFLKSVKDEDFLQIETTDSNVGVKHQGVIVLHNLRSAFNIGSILRSAEAFGFSEVVLTGYTPGLDNPKTKKSSMGVEENLNIRSELSIEKVLESYGEKGYDIFGIETHKEGKSLESFTFPEKAVLVFGNERFGISKEAFLYIDEWVYIPLMGAKKSLNVSICAGICMNHFVVGLKQ